MTASEVLIAAAVAYAERGWSVIPLRADKKARVPWKVAQTVRAAPGELAGWFDRLKDVEGVGVVLGAVAGNLAARDFDDAAAYRRWAATYADLAASLPTVRTGRGFHVYFRAAGVKTRKLGDGELRGEGAYMVLPPSRHPSGAVYSWLVPLPRGELPELDAEAAGLARPWIGSPEGESATERTERTEKAETTERTETTETTEDTEDTDAIVDGWSEETRAAIDDAIRRTIPPTYGDRNGYVFKLCRALQAVPELKRIKPKRVRVLKPVVREWHRRGMANMLTKDFGTTWADFAYAWPRVRVPEGDDVLRRALEAAEAAPPPAWAREDYTEPRMLLLASICRELQRIAEGGVFFLSARTAGRLVDVDQGTACRWLHAFVADGALEEVKKGDKSGRATRWRYVAGDLHESK